MNRIRGFDGIRGLSILMVLLTHLGFYDQWANNPFFYNRVIHLVNGTAGVHIFFCLSGFLITHLLAVEKQSFQKVDVRNFYIRRALRLGPPFLLLAILIFCLRNFTPVFIPIQGIAYFLLYLYNFVPREFYSGELGHTWSLAVEEQFYLVWPLVLLTFRNNRWIYITATVLIIICIASKPFFDSVQMHHDGTEVPLASLYFVDRWFIPASAFIMIGAVFGLFYHDQSLTKWINAYSKTSLAMSLFLYILPLFATGSFIGYSLYLQAIGVCIFLYWIAVNNNSIVVDTLEFQPLAYLGVISYGVYIYQGVFLRTGPNGILDIQHFPVNLVLTLATAILSYHFIEKRLLLLKKKFGNRL